MQQFDLQLGVAEKDTGLDLVEANNPNWVSAMRAVAAGLAVRSGSVHVDDLRPYCAVHGQPGHKNAWGAIFRGPMWIKIGMRKSALVSNHGHPSPVWALR